MGDGRRKEVTKNEGTKGRNSEIEDGRMPPTNNSPLCFFVGCSSATPKNSLLFRWVARQPLNAFHRFVVGGLWLVVGGWWLVVGGFAALTGCGAVWMRVCTEIYELAWMRWMYFAR
jgi:hypothetical protein